ncbi:MAG: glycosyltransferase family 1 protein [Arenimonas sp.]
MLDIADSQDIYQILLKSDFSKRTRVVWLVTRAFLSFKANVVLKGSFLFNTGHSGLEKSTYPRHLAALGVKPIFFVHDLIPITHAEYCRAGEREKHSARMKTVLQLANGVITNSQYTLDSLEKFAHQQAVAVPPSVVVMLAPADLPSLNNSRPMLEPYFVMLGTIEPRKNHWMMLQVWRRMLEQQLVKVPKLVIIGQRGWECENVIDLLERCDIIQSHVVELSSCSDVTLANYLQHAQALLFPSFVEGFGMPLVEAMASGIPVIVSDISAFREIAGDIPEYLDPLDANAWVAEILRFCDSSVASRNLQLQRMRKFQATSWPEHFEKIEAFLERLT